MTEQVYFDPQGYPIDVVSWGALLESRKRPTRLSHVGTRTLKTVWLGMVDPRDPGARLFGSGVYADRGTVTEVELYDSQDEAYDGHARHLLAMKQGYHCDACKSGRQHP